VPAQEEVAPGRLTLAAEARTTPADCRAGSGGGMTEFEARIAALPIWQGAPKIEPLSGGLSNVSVIVTDSSGRYVVRSSAEAPFHHVSRERELAVARAAHAA